MKFTSRPYEGERDLQQMQGLLMTARSRSDDWRYVHIGELTFRFFMVACHLNPQEHVRLWHDEDRELVGYAILGEDPFFDWQVLPEHEWSGIELEALDWAETRLTELRRRDPQQWGGSLVSGARQDNGRRRVFLGQHGFRYSGEFAEVNMLRSLATPISQPVLPPGCQVRAIAEAGEVSKRAAAHREVWQPWTDGNITDEDYADFMRLPAYRRDLDVVAMAPNGDIAAFVVGWIDPVNRIGELGSVGAVPAYRRQGLMRAVLLEGLRRMQACGMERACVSTGVSNIPAIRLYESVGFEIVNQYLDYVKHDAHSGAACSKLLVQ
jgi:ribosomal protein S18 acetylase RimI-like enzyme